MEKGAFQLSLGFIIAVVFAVVMLSLAITWLRGMMGGMVTLTDDLTQQAQSNLRDTFRQTASNFAVWPSWYGIERGKGMKMSAGIENDDPKGINHYFVINIIPAAVSEDVKIGGSNCSLGDVSKCQAFYDEMLRWITFDRSITRISINTAGYKFISFTIPPNTPTGDYMYNAVACYDGATTEGAATVGNTPLSDECDTTNPKLWGNPQPITITVK